MGYQDGWEEVSSISLFFSSVTCPHMDAAEAAEIDFHYLFHICRLYRNANAMALTPPSIEDR